ncbi:MAG: aminotransferase class IV [Candidatus Magnetomorum sp.]|nr:aminotransferase class IV [Candidatus Magnetomorum sp.]
MYLWNNHSLIQSPEQTFLSDIFQGKGIFETILVTDKTCFFLWDEHIQRLNKGIQFLGKQTGIDFKALHHALTELFHCENLKDFFRLNIVYLPEKDTVIVRVFPFLFPKKPARLYLDTHYYRGNSPHYQYKTLSRMENLYFQQVAQTNHCDDFLMIDTHQQVLETCLANIFFVREDGVFETPVAQNMPLLNGILRSFLINAQKDLDIQCLEKNISINHISKYSQAFITNGLRLVQPVSRIGEWFYAKDNIGWELLDRLLRPKTAYGQ